ncbi:uncharacterized protein [Nicotiana sylvestris]|uniref:uncharacterized protein n=1 Tax=Nicotiana sylvestris TaxID=4096 RepID=UPI00388CC739
MTGTDSSVTPSLSRSTSQAVNHDVNHPYFLHSSDAPGMTLVTSPFDGRGFPRWRRSILIALSAKNKLAFINGICDEPVLDSKDHAQWRDSVIYSKSAKELWNSLEHRFGQSNGAKLYHLQKEVAKTVQGNSSIAGYLTTLKKLWDELDSLNSHLGCTCTCVCEGKKKVAKFLEDQRVIQFLMGLNDVYAHARGNILMMSPLPNMDHTYSILLQDESQREIFVSPQYPTDGASFMVGPQGKFNQRNNIQKSWGTPQKQGNIQNMQQKFKKKAKYNPNVSCSHCVRTGHVREDCYRLIGFPDDFQFTKSINYQPAIKGNAVVTGQEGQEKNNTCSEGNISRQNQFFSKEQVSELVNVIKQVQIGSAAATTSEINANVVAGTVL